MKRHGWLIVRVAMIVMNVHGGARVYDTDVNVEFRIISREPVTFNLTIHHLPRSYAWREYKAGQTEKKVAHPVCAEYYT